jgi:hypothetical protein
LQRTSKRTRWQRDWWPQQRTGLGLALHGQAKACPTKAVATPRAVQISARSVRAISIIVKGTEPRFSAVTMGRRCAVKRMGLMLFRSLSETIIWVMCSMRYRAGYLAFLLLIASGCTRSTVMRQRRAAAEAAKDLRQSYNASCGSAFQEADEVLRKDPQFDGQSWVAECRSLQRELGSWLKFDIQANDVSEAHPINAKTNQIEGAVVPDFKWLRTVGVAKFQNRECRVDILWALDTARDLARNARKPQLVGWTLTSPDNLAREIAPRPRPYDGPRKAAPSDRGPTLIDPPHPHMPVGG